MALCLAVTAPLEWTLGARVYRQPKRLAKVLGFTLLPFLCWDAIAIHRKQWHFDSRYVTGLRVPFDIPIEELTFFLVVPICVILTFEVVSKGIRRG